MKDVNHSSSVAEMINARQEAMDARLHDLVKAIDAAFAAGPGSPAWADAEHDYCVAWLNTTLSPWVIG